MSYIFSKKVLEKLTTKHGVSRDEVEQCFANRYGEYIKDVREEHASDPPTLWFIAETNDGKLLKIVFIPKNEGLVIRTAFRASESVVRVYNKYGNIDK